MPRSTIQAERNVLRTFYPTTCDGHGPGFTCAQLVEHIDKTGQDVSLHVNRYTSDPGGADVSAAIPSFLNYVPYRVLSESASQRSAQAFLRDIGSGDVAWLWPSAPLQVHEVLAERGVPIILEAINSRMAVAKPILDAAYIEAGLAPDHGITDARIAEEEAKWSLASAIFSTSETTDLAAQGTVLEKSLLRTSYGTRVRNLPETAPAARDGRIEFIFVGKLCIRKGVDRLIRLWSDLPKEFHLTLIGDAEPALSGYLASAEAAENITITGFVQDVSARLRRSDVFLFPSLEEGDALVSYEAANAGLALLVSKVGGGRLVSETGCANMLDPFNTEQMKSAILAIGRDAEMRRDLARRARQAVRDFDWSHVAAQRMELLAPYFGAQIRSGTDRAAKIGR